MTRPDPRFAQNPDSPEKAGVLARMALALTDWTERWVPDAFVFALVATLIVVVAGVAFTPSSVPAGDRCLGERFLGANPIHPADGTDHYHRARARDVAAGRAGSFAG